MARGNTVGARGRLIEEQSEKRRKMRFTAWIKKLRHHSEPYCHQCGRNRHSFFEPDVVSRLIAKKIGKNTEYLCFDCFCKACEEAGLPAIWQLSSCQGSSQQLCQSARGGKKILHPPTKILTEPLKKQNKNPEETVRELGGPNAEAFFDEEVGGCG